MKQQHPITPPPELVEKLLMLDTSEEGRLIAAYRVGADQELDECCGWLATYRKPILGDDLRYVRRPKLPSLKEQALSLVPEPGGLPMKWTFSPDELLTIRRALEQLDD